MVETSLAWLVSTVWPRRRNLLVCEISTEQDLYIMILVTGS